MKELYGTPDRTRKNHVAPRENMKESRGTHDRTRKNHVAPLTEERTYVTPLAKHFGSTNLTYVTLFWFIKTITDKQNNHFNVDKLN